MASHTCTHTEHISPHLLTRIFWGIFLAHFGTCTITLFMISGLEISSQFSTHLWGKTLLTPEAPGEGPVRGWGEGKEVHTKSSPIT